MSRKISRVPVESLTLLPTCSTEMTQSDMTFNSQTGDHTRRDFIASGLLLKAVGLSALWHLPAMSQTKARSVLVVGDSLSAEYGLKRGSGWVALLEKKLASEKVNATVVNASISGDTTSGGRARLPALLLRHKPSLVVIELGGNDALRGLPISLTQDNLTHMARLALDTGARVLLLGMQVPPNYGKSYALAFESMYQEVAKTKRVGLVPFMLKGIADVPDSLKWFQADRIHPKEDAHPVILANVWPDIKKGLQ